MKMARRIPIVQAALERTRYSWVWIVTTCPYCGQPHEHYGGPLDHDPYPYLAHCITSTCNTDAQQALAMKTPRRRLEYILQTQAKRETELRHDGDARAGGQSGSLPTRRQT